MIKSQVYCFFLRPCVRWMQMRFLGAMQECSFMDLLYHHAQFGGAGRCGQKIHCFLLQTNMTTIKPFKH